MLLSICKGYCFQRLPNCAVNCVNSCFSALHCQPDNIKAMYRRALALKELGRYQEALKQAKNGKKLDTKVCLNVVCG